MYRKSNARSEGIKTLSHSTLEGEVQIAFEKRMTGKN
jgi:hypothetical protein